MCVSLCYGTVLLLAIILAALFCVRARRGPIAAWWPRRQSEPFSLAAPSPPLAREAAAGFAASVRAFQAAAAAARGEPPGHSAACGEGLAQMEAALAPAEALFRAPPTLANHLAAYQGLKEAPPDLVALAECLRAEARARSPGPNLADPRPCPALLAAARHLEEAARSVHRLGAALDLE
jgi:hypothetical protein